MKHKIIVINGPNLNLLGEREKEKYGNISLKNVETNCLNYAKNNDIELSFVQSNIEGELVNIIQESRNKYNGLIINAAGYTHTSVSILDSLSVLKIPFSLKLYNRLNKMMHYMSILALVVWLQICQIMNSIVLKVHKIITSFTKA